MKLVNAGIKTKEEALKRMIDGEVFYFSTSTIDFKIYFDMKCIEDKCSPFKVKVIHNGNIESLQRDLSNFSEFKKKQVWYKNITKPVPCWVSDIDEKEKSTIRLIDYFDERTLVFFAVDTHSWAYATPLTKEDLYGED